MSHVSRYSRQQLVNQFSGEAQDRIRDACVLIVGAGGLGSPVSLFLAGAGVGKMILVDDDIVSVSNLHRQILYEESDVGQAKVTAAKRRLSSLNSDIDIEVVNQALNPLNAPELVGRASVIVDAADNFLVSYILSDLCLIDRKPLITASVLNTHGYLGVFCGSQELPAPSMRAVFASPSQTAANCNTAGVVGPSVGVIGSYQAQEALKVILQDENQLLGKLMYLDLWDYGQNIIDFSEAQEPEQHAPIIANHDICTADFVLDVRSVQEVQSKPLAYHTLNIPNSELLNKLQLLPVDQNIICVCASGQRALNAAHKLLGNGFSSVYVSSANYA